MFNIIKYFKIRQLRKDTIKLIYKDSPLTEKQINAISDIFNIMRKNNLEKYIIINNERKKK